ncbi:MAG: type II toxin-antitoxin system Phd/YefM family antitoxin [Saprospiraceae bacterium]|nr:type II toxin-antitoxin system Phd/YefM family antitoxin [Pyrinomonadaceae bacterium]
MAVQTTYSNARNKLASLLARVTDPNEIVIINRPGYENVLMVTASELSGLLETGHLMPSTKSGSGIS